MTTDNSKNNNDLPLPPAYTGILYLDSFLSAESTLLTIDPAITQNPESPLTPALFRILDSGLRAILSAQLEVIRTSQPSLTPDQTEQAIQAVKAYTDYLNGRK